MKDYIVLNIRKNFFKKINNILENIREYKIKSNFKKKYNRSIYQNKFIYYLENNISKYTLIILMYIIGIILGCIYINNISYDDKTNIYDYTINTIDKMKEYKNSNNEIKINNKTLLKKSIIRNILIGLAIMIFGPTILGNITIYIILVFNGFCLGFTISTITMSLGTRERNFIYWKRNITSKYYFYTNIVYNSKNCFRYV